MKLHFLALVAVVLAPPAPLGAAEARPNILILFADDQRADTIAALGNPVIKTPNLDRLVHRGVAFNRAWMQGAMQGATCVPSRAMLFSGRNLFHIDEKLMRDATWPEAFGKAGYTTFISGKWHNGDASLARSFQIARSMFTGGMTNPMKAKLRDVIDGKVGEAKLAPKHACEVFADEAIRFLHEQAEKKGGPFFACVPFDAPHDPHIVPDDFPVKYEAATIPLPPSFLPQHPWDNGDMAVRDEKLLPWPRTPDAVRALIAEYYRYISYLDVQIGRVLDALDASPFAKSTIVVFSADSGVARGSHGLIGKQNVYEYDSVRVPLIIAGPGIRAGQRTEAMCYLFDVLPTLGKLSGVSSPNAGDGFDFSATLADPAQPARDHLMFAYRNFQRGFTDGRWKLIRYPQVDRTQLFDLQSDPHEATNLADKPEHAAKVAELLERLEKDMRESGDKAVLKVANPKPAEWHPPASL
jgi:arylsulfatase A-like enzyme